MRNKILLLAAILSLVAGCAVLQSRKAYNTLATIGYSANTTYQGYMDLVVKGATPTNPVPVISHAYNDFQAGYGTAVSAAQFNLTNITPANVMDLYSNLVLLIQRARGQ